MLTYILHAPSEAVAMILAGIGLSALLLHRNPIRKVMGLQVMASALCLFMTAHCRAAEILLPEGLLMTALASASALTAIALALTLRLYRHYGVLDIDRLEAHSKIQDIQELELENEQQADQDRDMEELWAEIEQLKRDRELEIAREHELERQLRRGRERERELAGELQELAHELESRIDFESKSGFTLEDVDTEIKPGLDNTPEVES